MTPEEIASYDRLVPRYTSYPTAPHFTPAIDAARYRRWLAEVPAGSELSLYLHLPFCAKLCWFCGCHT
ncbi:MAG: coproporphyrinogen III oxidase, partial [Alphaproteobacteria bacterium]